MHYRSLRDCFTKWISRAEGNNENWCKTQQLNNFPEKRQRMWVRLIMPSALCTRSWVCFLKESIIFYIFVFLKSPNFLQRNVVERRAREEKKIIKLKFTKKRRKKSSLRCCFWSSTTVIIVFDPQKAQFGNFRSRFIDHQFNDLL